MKYKSLEDERLAFFQKYMERAKNWPDDLSKRHDAITRNCCVIYDDWLDTVRDGQSEYLNDMNLCWDGVMEHDEYVNDVLAMTQIFQCPLTEQERLEIIETFWEDYQCEHSEETKAFFAEWDRKMEEANNEHKPLYPWMSEEEKQAEIEKTVKDFGKGDPVLERRTRIYYTKLVNGEMSINEFIEEVKSGRFRTV